MLLSLHISSNNHFIKILNSTGSQWCCDSGWQTYKCQQGPICLQWSAKHQLRLGKLQLSQVTGLCRSDFWRKF